MLNDEVRERIKSLMKEKKIKGYELAKEVNITASSLSDLLSAKKKKALNIDDLFRFAKALGVTEYFLLTGIEDEYRNVAKITGLSGKTINNIQKLDNKKRTLLEMLINDEGRSLSTKKEIDLELEPEKGFMDAFSDYVCDPMGNQIVEILYSGSGSEENPYLERIIKQAPHKYRIQLSDGSLHEVTEWMPNGKMVSGRLKAIRARYLNSLTPLQYIPTEEEDDEE